MGRTRRLTVLDMLHDWTHKYFSDPEAVILLLFLVGGTMFIVFTGGVLAPVYASVIIAYLLQGVVEFLRRRGVSRFLGVMLTYLSFLALYVASFIFIMPLIWKQMTTLFSDLPKLIQEAQVAVDNIAKQVPMYVNGANSDGAFSASILQNLQGWSKAILSASLSSIPGVLNLLVYFILVPLLVFFFMKDSEKITSWFVGFLPTKKGLLVRVWTEVNQQIGNYVRGKAIEIIIVFIATYAGLAYFGVNYALLLAFLVGLSVVIPYVGGIVVTIPVFLVAFLQFGWSDVFIYSMITYLVIQGLDANILVPLLYSEAVSLHPVAIMVAILAFGAVWGFWGVFFAIPLATLVKSVIYAWPVLQD